MFGRSTGIRRSLASGQVHIGRSERALRVLPRPSRSLSRGAVSSFYGEGGGEAKEIATTATSWSFFEMDNTNELRPRVCSYSPQVARRGVKWWPDRWEDGSGKIEEVSKGPNEINNECGAKCCRRLHICLMGTLLIAADHRCARHGRKYHDHQLCRQPRSLETTAIVALGR
jgi:hypothetical protein